MKAIILNSGMEAMVDDDDYDWLNQFKWFHHNDWNQIYAKTILPGFRYFLMHSMLLGTKTGYIIDHRNRNGLDNQRKNLRFCTKSQNALNSLPQSRNPTGFKGVYVHRNGFQAKIQLGNRKLYLGKFNNAIDAAKAYNAAAFEAEPEFAWLNPIPQEN